MPGGGEAYGVMGGQYVVGIGWLGLGSDADGGSGGGIYVGGGVDGWDSDGDRINRWYDTIVNVILET